MWVTSPGSIVAPSSKKSKAAGWTVSTTATHICIHLLEQNPINPQFFTRTYTIVHGTSMFHWWHHHFLLITQPMFVAWTPMFVGHDLLPAPKPPFRFMKFTCVHQSSLECASQIWYNCITIIKLPWKHHRWWFHPNFCCFWNPNPSRFWASAVPQQWAPRRVPRRPPARARGRAPPRGTRSPPSRHRRRPYAGDSLGEVRFGSVKPMVKGKVIWMVIYVLYIHTTIVHQPSIPTKWLVSIYFFLMVVDR